MRKHRISGIESGFSGSMFVDSSVVTGMNVLDARDGLTTDTYMQRIVEKFEEEDRNRELTNFIVSTEVMVA